MEYKLSTYQQNIIDAFLNTDDNLFISALAGAGKTFILTQISKHINTYSVFLAFNKTIQLDLLKKITNPKFKTYTFNGLGYMIMMKNMENSHKQVTLDKFKLSNIIKKVLSEDKSFNLLPWDLRLDYIKEFSTLYQLIQSKLIDVTDYKQINTLIENYELFSELQVPSYLNSAIKKIDEENIRAFDVDGLITFNDQLYITLKKLQSQEWETPGYLLFNYILCDESQDLNACQQQLLFFIKRKTSRFIFAGDKNQAIYGFNGADVNSINTLQNLFKTKEFPLPINYRCAKSHLSYVNSKFNIGILPMDNAIQGSIQNIAYDELCYFAKQGDFILSRKNSDLCKIILQLLQQGKPIYFKDATFVMKMITFLKGKTKDMQSILPLERKITQFKVSCHKKIEEALKKTLDKDSHFNKEEIEKYNFSNEKIDLFDCIQILLKNYRKAGSDVSIQGFLNYISKMLNTQNPQNCIICSSIHQVKGLETNNVFILNKARPMYDLARTASQRIQEKNLSYIALTRAKSNLYLVESEK